MRFVNGLPVDNGASDLADSARLAGIMTVFGIYNVACHKYVNLFYQRYERHPDDKSGYDFSRDQTIPLVAGLYKKGMQELVNIKYVTGKDFFGPSHRGHIRYCQGKDYIWYQKLFLWIDILWACYVDKEHENNQLLCMLYILKDRRPLKFYLNNCKTWEKTLREYWSGWRGEPGLAEDLTNILNKEM